MLAFNNTFFVMRIKKGRRSVSIDYFYLFIKIFKHYEERKVFLRSIHAAGCFMQQ